METFAIGDRVQDWDGNEGIVVEAYIVKIPDPNVEPYQRVKVEYPGTKRRTGGSSDAYQSV